MQNTLIALQTSLKGVRALADDVDLNLPAAVGNADVLARLNLVRSLCPVAISGYFESFLKDLARVALQDVNSRALPYGSLPEKMRKVHHEAGGEALKMKAGRPDRVAWITATPDDLARRIGSTSQSTYELAWEAFADTQANPGPRVVTEFLGRYGCKDVGRALASAAGQTWEAMELALNDLLLKRNECAHTGQIVAVPTTTEIRRHCDTVEQFAGAIVHVLRQHFAGVPFSLPLNTASADELSRIPGVGPTKAQAIAAHRSTHGAFATVDDVVAVPRVGRRAIEALRRCAHV